MSIPTMTNRNKSQEIPVLAKKPKSLMYCWWESKLVQLLWKIVWWLLKR